LKQVAGHVSEYCPHTPDVGEHRLDAAAYWLCSRSFVHVRNLQSAVDGIVAYAVLFSMLFISSLAGLTTDGLAEVYRSSVLKIGLATGLALGIIVLYLKLRTKKFPEFRIANGRESLLASMVVLVVWASAWVLFGAISGTYRIAFEPTRGGLTPLTFCVGLLDGAIVYGYCTERLVTGLGRAAGVLVSSVFGWLAFIALSVDFALYLAPIVIVLACVDVRTGSPLGPTVATGLLMAFFYAWFGMSPWILGSRVTGYWLMTIISAVTASLAGLTLTKLPLRDGSYAQNVTI